jgi:hypothetical protein
MEEMPMNGKVLGVAFVLLIFMVACLISVPVMSGPIIGGEHPWTSDRSGDVNSETTKPNATTYEDSLATLQTQGVTPPDDSEATESMSVVNVILQVMSVASMMF